MPTARNTDQSSGRPVSERRQRCRRSSFSAETERVINAGHGYYRLRDVEAVIENDSDTGNKHFMILPWQHLPNLAKPSKRDAHLFEAISDCPILHTPDPAHPRSCTPWIRYTWANCAMGLIVATLSS